NVSGAAGKDLVAGEGHRIGHVSAGEGLGYDPPIAEGRVQRPIRVVAHQAEVVVSTVRCLTDGDNLPGVGSPGWVKRHRGTGCAAGGDLGGHDAGGVESRIEETGGGHAAVFQGFDPGPNAMLGGPAGSPRE